MPKLTPVPLSPEGLLGLTNFDGETLAVLSPSTIHSGAPQAVARQLLVLNGAERLALAIDGVERLDRSAQPPDQIVELPVERWAAQAFPLRSGARRNRASNGAAAARPNSEEERVALLPVHLGGQLFAFPLEEVVELLPVPADIAPLPGAEAAVLGSILWRDGTIGLLSLAALLGIADEAHANRSRRRILVAGIGQHRIGLLVDHVEGVLQVSPTRIDNVPSTVLCGDGKARIRAICRPETGGRLISILAGDQLFTEARTQRLLTMAKSEAAAPQPTCQEETEPLLPVRIGLHELAFPLSAVERVMLLPPRLTPVPASPAWLRGVAAIDGEPLPIIDQVHRLTGSPAAGARQRLIILRANGQSVGFLVDQARAVIQAEKRNLAPAPLPAALAHGIFGDALHHVGPQGEETLLILEPEALISSAEQALLAKIAAT